MLYHIVLCIIKQIYSFRRLINMDELRLDV